MGKMIFVAGGTGFIGRRLMEALAGEGYKVKCLVRSERKARVCVDLGFETVTGDITDRASLKGALSGAGTVIHLVGIASEAGGQTFEDVHVRGTSNLLEEATSEGVSHFFYQSALGADPRSWSKYQASKGRAEELVKASGIPYTIFRPSLVMGGDDGFTSKVIDAVKAPGPFIPVPGKGMARFQPIYVWDIVKCLLKIIDNPEALGRTYELGGPEHLTYVEIVKAVAHAMAKDKPLLHVPALLVKISAPVLGIASAEQIKLLEKDNITDLDSVRKAFGFEPVKLGEALKAYFTTSTGHPE